MIYYLDDYKIESMRKRMKKFHINDNDEYEAHNNPNLHSEEQDELELPENTKELYKLDKIITPVFFFL
ncbi:hypothetical protein RhiirC2_784037 [Rhizophagus irregularis]|uniref:Uncharacterized protein n=1 Tax=Rhizophagus irregularis TaxID=588596 RepID=A0A2N1MZK2_9GLOM|nr:hypothetical protein RhiirC2_784037 [Rhizophagus irregularis]